MNKVVNPRRNFAKDPFHYPDIVQSSIGPVHLCFTHNEAGDPPMINIYDAGSWYKELDLELPNYCLSPDRMNRELHLTFAFSSDAGWHADRWNEKRQTVKIDGTEIPLPHTLEAEFAGYIAAWARKNQDRYAEYQLKRWQESMAFLAKCLEEDEPLCELPGVEEIDEIISSQWSRAVEPDQLVLAGHVRAAVAQMQDAVAAAREAFKPFKAIADEDAA
jgi:hypothetical protein